MVGFVVPRIAAFHWLAGQADKLTMTGSPTNLLTQFDRGRHHDKWDYNSFRNLATEMFSCSLYLATVLRAI